MSTGFCLGDPGLSGPTPACFMHTHLEGKHRGVTGVGTRDAEHFHRRSFANQSRCLCICWSHPTRHSMLGTLAPSPMCCSPTSRPRGPQGPPPQVFRPLTTTILSQTPKWRLRALLGAPVAHKLKYKRLRLRFKTENLLGANSRPPGQVPGRDSPRGPVPCPSEGAAP